MRRQLPVYEFSYTDNRALHQLLEPPVNSVTGSLLFCKLSNYKPCQFSILYIVDLLRKRRLYVHSCLLLHCLNPNFLLPFHCSVNICIFCNSLTIISYEGQACRVFGRVQGMAEANTHCCDSMSCFSLPPVI